MDPALPWRVDASPDEVKLRLAAELVGIRSVWFPTAAELDEWIRSPVPLYVRWLGPHAFEIGPRLASPSAARLCAVWRGSLDSDGTGTVVRATFGFTRLTSALLVGFAAVLVLWVAWVATLWSLGDPLVFRWIALWAVAVVVALVSAGGGWLTGRRALREHAAWLHSRMTSHHVNDDW